MLIGPARLCSMVSEHDDTLNSITEQLTIDIFSVPSIQVLFIIKILKFISHWYIFIICVLAIYVCHQHVGHVYY